jgi:hypothetical protein
MKTKQIFRNLLLGGLLVTTFVGLQISKQANAKVCSNLNPNLGLINWYKTSCTQYGCVGWTCRTQPDIHFFCPSNWENNPNYQCTCN